MKYLCLPAAGLNLSSSMSHLRNLFLNKMKLKNFSSEEISNLSKEPVRYLLYGPWLVKIPNSFYHPGGSALLDKFLPPKDCSMYFETTRQGQGHSKKARKLLTKYVVGYITKEKPSYNIGTLPNLINKSYFTLIRDGVGFILFLVVHLFVFYIVTNKTID